MTTSRPDNEAIFHAAREIPDPDRRRQYVREACGGDEARLADVEALLAAADAPDSLLDRPAESGPGATMGLPPAAEGPGTIIGPYKLLEAIGEGGMGTVYMAEQSAPVRRRVALKVIKPGMDTRQVVARFEAERQALAMMDHPNIARVLDAGATDSGRPYFVLELVRGVPITRFCDERRLTPRQRLELFIPVCQAVQHAHQKGIIHRDIKPPNVLVALYDGEPVPKVIDFGVAKATGPRLTERTLYTEFGAVVGTLEYMSPEQAELNQLDIDTRSDIYSLGVLLYELLTGTTPLQRKRLERTALLEALRLIREEEPPRPSTWLGTTEELPSIAAARGVEPRRLSGMVRGELDWIVMKTLEKDRNRRYETATAFAADVQRYLNDEPIQACPPSTAYRLSKFVRRNKATVVSAGLVLVSLIGGIVGTSWQAVRATAERNEKEQAREESVANERKAVAEAARALDQQALAQRQGERAGNNFRLAREAVDQMLTRVAGDMAGKPHMELIRRALLVDALKFYQGFLQQKGTDPTVRHETARAYLRVGRISMLLGQLEQADAPLEEAVGLLQKLSAEIPAVPEYRSELADAHDARSGLFADHQLNRPRERLEHALAALAVRKKLAADFPDCPQLRRQLAAQVLVVGLAYNRGFHNTKEGERYLQEGLAAWEGIHKETPDDHDALLNLSRAHHWRGMLFMDTGRMSEAEAEFRTELAIREKVPDGQLETFYDSHTKAYLAHVLLRTGRPGDAVPLVREAIAIREKVLDDFPNDYHHWRRLCLEYKLLGQCLVALGCTDQAERALRQSLAMAKKLATDFHGVPAVNTSYDLAWKHYDLGLFLHDTGQVAEAAGMFRQAQLIFEEHAAKLPDSPARLHALAWFLADCPATRFRDPRRAMELAKKGLTLEPQSGRYWSVLGLAQARAGQWKDADESLRKSLNLSDGGDSHDWFVLASAQWHLGHKQQARQLYDDAVRWMEAHMSQDEELRRLRAETEELTGFAKRN